MALQVTGKHIEVGKALSTYVEDKLAAAFEKYTGHHLAAHVRIEKSRGRFKTSCSVRLRTGLTLEAEGQAPDAYLSADEALEHLEKRLRRYKRRLKSHHYGANGPRRIPRIRVTGTTLDDEPTGVEGGDVSDDETASTGEANSLIIAEPIDELEVLSVKSAAERLVASQKAFMAFRNASTGLLDVVYRRADGHVGWINAGGCKNGTTMKSGASC